MQRFPVRRNRVAKILNAEVRKARQRTSFLLRGKIGPSLPDLNLVGEEKKSYAKD